MPHVSRIQTLLPSVTLLPEKPTPDDGVFALGTMRVHLHRLLFILSPAHFIRSFFEIPEGLSNPQRRESQSKSLLEEIAPFREELGQFNDRDHFAVTDAIAQILESDANHPLAQAVDAFVARVYPAWVEGLEEDRANPVGAIDRTREIVRDCWAHLQVCASAMPENFLATRQQALDHLVERFNKIAIRKVVELLDILRSLGDWYRLALKHLIEIDPRINGGGYQTTQDFALMHRGHFWDVTFAGAPLHLKNVDGTIYLARLIAFQGSWTSAAQIYRAIEASNSWSPQPILEQEDVAKLLEIKGTLETSLQDAQESADAPSVAEISEALEHVQEALDNGFARGRVRPIMRRFNSPSDQGKAYRNVKRAIERLLVEIREISEPFARHLAAALEYDAKGGSLRYAPSPALLWQIQVPDPKPGDRLGSVLERRASADELK